VKKLTAILILLCGISPAFPQQIDLNNAKSNFSKESLLKISGGLSASSVYYTGNEAYQRDPWSYFLNGNINFNVLGLIDLPFSFNFTNSGANRTYPTMPNRLSLHPAYKFLTGHIGDVSMSFSPYTLNGHQFSGAGIDVNPDRPLKFSVMYGRLQKAVEFGDGGNTVQAAYKRIGGGINLRYEESGYQLSASMFSAKDDDNSLSWKPDSLNITPMQNVAGSVNLGVSIVKNLQFSVEYGISLLNRDIRYPDKESGNETFHALKTGFSYTFMNNTVGIGYERVDPGYATLGAYYFNNDLENITVNYARPFFSNKANIALSAGLQHDDLENRNESQTSRLVFSADASYAPSDRLNFAGSYTTFQTHSNLRSQFDYINELTPYDNLDTLNFTQLSQNANFNTSYMFGGNDTKHQINLLLSYQEAADKQGDIIPEGAASLFYNASMSYGIQLVPKNLNINLSLNATENRMNRQDMYILGPTLGVTGRFFEQKLSSGITASYNTSYMASVRQNEVWNLRLNSAYTLRKKHVFSMTAIYRNNTAMRNAMMDRTSGLTVSTAYSYRF
jgi:hypothetical protein